MLVYLSVAALISLIWLPLKNEFYLVHRLEGGTLSQKEFNIFCFHGFGICGLFWPILIKPFRGGVIGILNEI